MQKLIFFFVFLFLLPTVHAETCEELQELCKKADDEMNLQTSQNCQKSLDLCTKAQKICADEAKRESKKRELLSSTSAHHLNMRQTCRDMEVKKEK